MDNLQYPLMRSWRTQKERYAKYPRRIDANINLATFFPKKPPSFISRKVKPMRFLSHIFNEPYSDSRQK